VTKHETKTFTAEVKADGDGIAAGQFVALVSVFDNVDLGGDRIVKGAFDASIKEWQAKGDPLPIIWSHEWDNPAAHIGYADPKDIRETDKGLEIKATLDTDRPFAEQVHHLLKNRRVTQFSFGYFAKDFEMVKDGDTQVRELKSLDIFEAGPTLLGMNPSTELLAAASYSREKSLDANGYALTQHQVLEAQALESIVEEVGKFDQSTAGAGAHYAPAEANPFKAAGLMCQNCVFYEGARGCEIVAGDIDPEAVCKLWVIPEALLAGDAAAEQMSVEGESKDATTVSETVEETATDTSESNDAGDTQGTIDIERVLSLVVRTQHEE
jgi:HK97 family phage prohead protease